MDTCLYLTNLTDKRWQVIKTTDSQVKNDVFLEELYVIHK